MILKSLYNYSLTNRIAACNGSDSLSFAALWERSEKIGAELIAKYNTASPVAIFGDKENDMLCCMFGAMKAGKPYICIPSYYPEKRITEMLKDSNADVVLNPSQNRLPIDFLPILDREEIRKNTGKESVSPDHYGKPEQTACLIYTSGSTGKPKGIRYTYRNLEAKVKLTDEFMGPSITENGGTAVNLAAYSFSASFSFVFYVMATRGYTLHCIPRNIVQNAEKLIQDIHEIQPNLLGCTPTVIERLLSADSFNSHSFPSLQYICLGGEPLHRETAFQCKNRFPKARVLNALGVSEAVGAPLWIEVTQDLFSQDFSFFPVGVASTDYAYLIDDQQNNRKANEIGELVVCCDTVSPGYLNQTEQTRNAFFTDTHGRWAYRTGDLLEVKNGLYFFHGRLDNQVKIGGNRFEIEDVESNLRRLSYIKDCAAAVRTNEDGVNSLVAFIVCKEKDRPNIEIFMKIKKDMKNAVPSYMIPSKILFVDSIPKNINFKIDRTALAKMVQEQ